MFESSLDAVKGWFHLAALDKTAPLDPTELENLTTVPAGRVAHIEEDAAGAPMFVLGGGGTQMPIFLWNGSDDADVTNDGVSPTTDVTHWVAISPAGYMNGLVATGGYELQTTEFDSEQNYLINDPLTSDGDGILTNAGVAQYTTWICGICSSHVNGDNQSVGLGAVDAPVGPVGTNAAGVLTLTFWPYFLPAAPIG
jgi:hypothetical protein